MSIELKNDFLRLEWDINGNLKEFANLKTSRQLVNTHACCRLILESPDFLEFETSPDGVCIIEQTSDTVCFHYDSMTGENGVKYALGLDLKAKICGNEITWQFEVENRAADIIIREVHYPVFTIRDPQPPLRVCTSEHVSTTYPDLPAMLRSRFTNYMAPDYKYIRHSAFYPGNPCSMNFFLLDYGSEVLYYGCHDPEFLLTGHNFEIEKNSNINCFMAQFPFAKNGERSVGKPIVTSLLAGTWKDAVCKYRAWADSWFVPPSPPQHIRESFGWQRVIMHHQYGEYFFKYTDLPGILEAGLPAGIDTIFLFGWTKEGMDAGYPSYTPDSGCGGFEELRKNIKKVREMGGHVIIYFNGQLIDASSEYYRSGAGQRVAIKRMDGTEHREFYNFSNTGTLLRNYGNKTFVVACPHSREWRDILKKHVDLAYSLGADGVFFDQLGYASYPCCDSSHGHPVPYTGLMMGKQEMCRELYDYAKSKDSNFAFGVECPTDQISAHCDFIHVFGNTAQVWNPDFRKTGDVPQRKCEVPLFSAAFPEIYLSDREIRDDSNVEFPVNQLFFQRRRSDVEICRCRKNISAAPKYGKYLEMANKLRTRFKEILFCGKLTENIVPVKDTSVMSAVFTLEDKLALVVSQSSKSEITVEIDLPGYDLLESGSIRDDAELNGNKLTLPKDSLMVLLFSKVH